MATLQEIRAKLLEQDAKSEQFQPDRVSYRYWDLPVDGSSVIRLLPDSDTNNPFFWVERQLIKMPFAGVVGETNRNTIYVHVPCMEMFQETCPVLSEIRPWFKSTEDMKALAKSYWKKNTYFLQGLVIQDGIPETEEPESPIRKFSFTSQIFQVIRAALMGTVKTDADMDIEEIPTDFVHGLDFRIVKTMDGKYSIYDKSHWVGRERPLSADELDKIETFGLNDLKSWLPAQPNAEAVSAIAEMFEASVNGEQYDLARWGKYFKPFNMNQTTEIKFGNDPAHVVETATREPVATKPNLVHIPESEMPPFDGGTVTTPVTSTPANSRAQDILQRIRSRPTQ